MVVVVVVVIVVVVVGIFPRNLPLESSPGIFPRNLPLEYHLILSLITLRITYYLTIVSSDNEKLSDSQGRDGPEYTLDYD